MKGREGEGARQRSLKREKKKEKRKQKKGHCMHETLDVFFFSQLKFPKSQGWAVLLDCRPHAADTDCALEISTLQLMTSKVEPYRRTILTTETSRVNIEMSSKWLVKDDVVWIEHDAKSLLSGMPATVGRKKFIAPTPERKRKSCHATEFGKIERAKEARPRVGSRGQRKSAVRTDEASPKQTEVWT